MNATKIRGRPRAFDVDRAIDTAMHLFHEHGYDGVGVATLAEAIGVNAPSLYAAFGSKLGLFERAVARYLAGDGSLITTALAEGGGPGDAVRRIFRRAAATYTAEGGCPGCLVMDGTRHCADPGARAVTDGLRREARESLVEWLGGHGVQEPDLLADYVLVGLAGLSAAARDGMGRAALHHAADLLADGFSSRLDDTKN